MAAVAAVFYAMNCLGTLKCDDILYMFAPGNPGARCDSVWKVFAMQPGFYVSENGRLADMVVRLFSGVLGKGVFNIANCAVLLLFLHLLARSVSRRTVPLLLTSCAFVWLVFPSPGETMLWMSGACNYLWSCTASLALFLYVERRGSRAHQAWHHVLLAAAAFVCGGMNESVSAACCAGLAGYFLFNAKKLTEGVNATVALAYLAGFAMIVCSPAAWERLGSGGDINLNAGVLPLLTRRVVNTVTKTGHYITPAIGLLAIALTWFRHGFRRVRSNLWAWLLLGGLVSVVVFSLTLARAYSWYAVAGFVVSMRWLWPIVEKRSRLSAAVGAAMALMVAGSSCLAIVSLWRYKQFNDRMERAIAASHDGVVKAARFEGRENRWVWRMNYENDDVISAYNPYLSSYYGKPDIQFLSDEMLARYRSPGEFAHGGKPMPFHSDATQLADSILSLDNAHYAIIPLNVGKAMASDTYCTATVANGAQVYTHKQLSQRERLGISTSIAKRSYYCLRHKGRCYVVVCHWPTGVTKLNVPLTVNGKETAVNFIAQQLQ